MGCSHRPFCSSFLSGSVLDVGRLQDANLGGVVAVVNAEDAFLAAGGDDGAVGADADSVDEIAVAAEVADVAAAGVEEFHLGVAATGRELVRLADEEKPRHLLRMGI